MTSQVLNKLGYLAVFVLIFAFWGCASDPVPAELPANHPANPEAAEAAYTAAPNPFQDKMSMDEMKSTDGPSMPHQGREDSPSHKMKPGHDTGHNSPEKSMDTKTKKSDRHHQEHD
jgi:hypothetical protein